MFSRHIAQLHEDQQAAYGMEAMAPSEIGLSTVCRSMLTNHSNLNDKMLLDILYTLKEYHDMALFCIQNYQQAAVKIYNKKVKNRQFTKHDLILRKVFEYAAEHNADQMGAHKKGPYLVSKIVTPGVYELVTMDGTPIPRS